jgi:ParB family chromosome partitioning protein
MMRKPLGRGLDALIDRTQPGLSEPSVAESDDSGGPYQRTALMQAPIEQIEPSPFQPRHHFDPEALDELANAIRAHGVIEPLIVRPAPGGIDGRRFELIAGERRLRASKLAGLETVPVIVRDLDDHATLEMSLVENLLREDLNTIEEARAFVRLSREFKLTHEQIAERIGKSRAYVTNTIRLMELPLPIIEAIAHGELTAGQARPLLALNSPDAQIAEARKIAEGGISSRQVEEIASARRIFKQGQGARPTGRDPNLNALAESIQRALRRKVRVIRQRGKTPGRVEIEFYNDDDLTALARMLDLAGRAM